MLPRKVISKNSKKHELKVNLIKLECIEVELEWIKAKQIIKLESHPKLGTLVSRKKLGYYNTYLELLQ